MHTFVLFFSAAVAVSASWGRCITDLQAQRIGRDFGLLVSNYSDTLAQNILAPGFTDQTDSVITLIDSAAEPQSPLTVCVPPDCYR